MVLAFQGSHCWNQRCHKGEGGRERDTSIVTQLPTCPSFTPHHQVSSCMSGVPTTLTLKESKGNKAVTAQSHDCTILLHTEMTAEAVRQWQPQLSCPGCPLLTAFSTHKPAIYFFGATMFAGKLSFRRTKNINKFRLRKWEEEEESGF